MKPVLNGDMKIAEIIEHYPQTSSVFAAHGMSALTSEDGLRVLAPFLTLATALRSRLINLDSFLRLLQEVVDQEYSSEAPGLDSYDKQGELSLLALMPCGLKVPFSKALAKGISRIEKQHNLQVRYAVEGNVNQELSYYPYISTLQKVEELPDIIVSADFNAFYGHGFYQRFVATGAMTGYNTIETGANFRNAGIIDPEGHYTILGINPLVIVVNLEQLNGRPVPTCWADLLDPMWEDSITLRGTEQFFCHAVLLPMYRDHGGTGLKKLAANVLQGLHPAQMVKQIDSNGPSALYVMPEFFAHRAKHQERVQIVWPEDGALASPVTLQVKAERREELKPVLDLLTSVELAQSLAGARYPVPHAEVTSAVQDKPLLWLGWDLLHKRDLLEVNSEIDALFLPYVKCINKG
ncbi:MAG: ABC transporter substrate-binding protein [Desulfuromonas sp.]|nr:ABC transporter substrate-binding protein [Desulfuromonas sp.]